MARVANCLSFVLCAESWYGLAASVDEGLPPMDDPVDWPILAPACLADSDPLAAFDDRASDMLPALRRYFSRA